MKIIVWLSAACENKKNNYPHHAKQPEFSVEDSVKVSASVLVVKL
jgi:hypothetical protein